MPATLQCIVLDCPEPVVLANFYQELLGGEVDRPDPRWRIDQDFSTLHVAGLVLGFQRSADYEPPQWPDPAHPQQFHLDFEVDDIEAEQRRVVGLGATLLRDHIGEDGYGFRVYADPVGHPFCLCHNKGVIWSDQAPIWPNRDRSGEPGGVEDS